MADLVGTPLDRPWRRISESGVIIGGAIAGLIGGVIMGGTVTLWCLALGMGASTPWQAVAATFYGPLAFVGAAGVTAIGVLLFIALAMAIGVIFSVLTYNATRSWPLIFWGVLFGTAVWAVMTYVFVPIFDPTLGARISFFAAFWLFLHWIYGAFTGLFIPSLRRAFSRNVAPFQARNRADSLRRAAED